MKKLIAIVAMLALSNGLCGMGERKLTLKDFSEESKCKELSEHISYGRTEHWHHRAAPIFAVAMPTLSTLVPFEVDFYRKLNKSNSTSERANICSMTLSFIGPLSVEIIRQERISSKASENKTYENLRKTYLEEEKMRYTKRPRILGSIFAFLGGLIGIGKREPYNNGWLSRLKPLFYTGIGYVAGRTISYPLERWRAKRVNTTISKDTIDKMVEENLQKKYNFRLQNKMNASPEVLLAGRE